METIKTTHELPDWFSLDNYEEILTSETDEKTLYEYASMGRLALWVLENLEYFPDAPTHYITEPHAVTRRASNFARYVVNILTEPPSEFKGLRPPNKAPRSHTVPLLEVHELDDLVQGKEAGIYSASLDDANVKFEPIDKVIENTKYIHVKLDRNMPDSIIIKELERLLPEYRRYLQIPETEKIFKKSDVAKIIDYKIIPLADLTTWAAYVKKHIPYRVLAAALFPDGYKGEEELRKTIIPLMQKVMDLKYLRVWEAHLKGWW